MIQMVRDEEIEHVRKILDQFVNFIKTVGEDWIENCLLLKEDRYSKHYLFWELFSEEKAKSINSWLEIICKNSSKDISNKFIRKLKDNRSRLDFLSFLPELEAYAHYINSNNFDEIIYEPNLQQERNKADLKLIKNSLEIYIEITRIFPDHMISKKTRIENILERRLNNLNGSYYANFKIYDEFKEEEIQDFIDGVRKYVISIDGCEEIEENIFYYVIEGVLKAEFKILGPSARSKLKIATIGPTGGQLESGGRLKFKMMDEVEQLPDGTLNIIILDVKDIYADMLDVENAVLGQEGIRINRVTGKVSSFRNPNGFIHTIQGNKVGLIIAFNEYEYHDRRKFVNMNANVKFPIEIISLL